MRIIFNARGLGLFLNPRIQYAYQNLANLHDIGIEIQENKQVCILK